MDINIETLRKTKGIGNKTLERIIEQHKIDSNVKFFKSKYIENNKYKINKDTNLWQGNCLELMNHIPDKSVDMILCDLPYGTTQNKWDEIILFEPLWIHYNRILKDKGNIVLFAQGIFTVNLIKSNQEDFKYRWVWDKGLSSGFLNANKMPLSKHEDIVVFNKGGSIFNPQFSIGKQNNSKGVKYKNGNQNNNYGDFNPVDNRDLLGNKKFPTTILQFNKPHPSVALHPTQKPIDLLEYLIKTYTNENMLVLDNTMGSGSTGVACKNTNRKFIGIELDEEYFNIAKDRINNAK